MDVRNTIMRRMGVVGGLAVAVLLLTLSAARPASAVPPHDDFGNAISISLPTYPEVVATADTTGATIQAGEPTPCGTLGATVWYTWTTNNTPPGFVSFDTHGSNFDTVIAAYTGPNLASLTNIACRDNQSGSDTRAAIGFIPAPNTTYYIQVGGFAGQTGSLVVSMGAGHNISVSGSADNNIADATLTLREAILLARGGTSITGLNRPLTAGESNFVTGTPFLLVPDQITFDMIHLRHDLSNITLTSPLPALDATGDVASGLGSTSNVLGNNFNCFSMSGTFNAVEAMRTTGCATAVLISGDNNIVRGNSLAAGGFGVDISAGAAGNLIGGSSDSARNVITTNTQDGVRILGAGADGNVVAGNYIGVAANGTAAGNLRGVEINSGARLNRVGGTVLGESNVISSNSVAGVWINGSGTNTNTVLGNVIGLAPDALTPRGNARGVWIQSGPTGNTIGGAAPGARNVIGSSGVVGVLVDASHGNTVANNTIGLAGDGLTARSNSWGVHVLNSNNALVQDNIVAGNAAVQVAVENGTGNQLKSNYIGLGADGLTAPANTPGILVTGTAANTLIGGSAILEGNTIAGNTRGIELQNSAAGTQIQGNTIGLGADGITAVPNAFGVYVAATATTTIGGTAPGARNIIAGNTNGPGIFLNSNGHIVIGNYIGLVADGITPVPNQQGVSIDNAISNRIGGSAAGERNVISGNSIGGVDIRAGESNQVLGNYIGTSADGTAAAANGIGVRIRANSKSNRIGSGLSGQGNVISGNAAQGVLVQSGSENNWVQGSLIGLDASGTIPIPNDVGVEILADAGPINLIGGGPSERNGISGNTDAGVAVTGDTHTISGNYIGTDASGNFAVPNGVGIKVGFTGVATNVRIGPGNVISGNTGAGVAIQSAAGVNPNYLRTNLIGTNATGTAAIGNGGAGVLLTASGFPDASVVIGGSTAFRNIISGNGGPGIDHDSSSQSTISSNFIGASKDGLSAIPNLTGIEVTDGAPLIQGNVISGNSGWGIDVPQNPFGALGLEANWIGTDANYFGPLGNGAGGIRSRSELPNGMVLSTSLPNTIAFNGGPGILIDGSATVQRILQQSIHSNAGLGIDLTNGANGGVASPYIGGIAGTMVSGTACPGCRVDVYSDSGEEGRFWHGSATASSFGLWSATVTPTAENITATATRNTDSTSEFSAPFLYAEACDGVDNDGDGQIDEGNTNTDGTGAADCVDTDDDNDTLLDTEDTCRTTAEDIDYFEDADGCPDTDNDGDGLCDPGLTSPACNGSDLGRQAWQSPLAAPQDCRSLPEDYDAFHDDDGCPEPDNDYDGYADAIDDCPGTDYTAGPDGISDSGDEPTDPLLTLTREDYDGVIDYDGCHDSPGDDWDQDGLTDEDEVFVMRTLPQNPDTDGDSFIDGSDTCPNWRNPTQALPDWRVPATDSDCDGFTTAREGIIGTDPAKHCAASGTANNEGPPDAWGVDFNDDRRVTILDVGAMSSVYGTNTSSPNWNVRFDLTPSGTITILDVSVFSQYFGKTCA